MTLDLSSLDLFCNLSAFKKFLTKQKRGFLAFKFFFVFTVYFMKLQSCDGSIAVTGADHSTIAQCFRWFFASLDRWHPRHVPFTMSWYYFLIPINILILILHTIRRNYAFISRRHNCPKIAKHYKGFSTEAKLWIYLKLMKRAPSLDMSMLFLRYFFSLFVF